MSTPERDDLDMLARRIEDGIYEDLADPINHDFSHGLDGYEPDYEEEDGPLVLRRKSDGRRFEIDVRVRVSLASPVEKHKATGTMSWPDPYPTGHRGAHAGIHCCDKPECQAEASEWVRSITGHDGIYSTFAENRAARQNAGAL